MEEGAKAVYTETEVDALIAAHAALATVHQNAPALIATHAANDDAHHTKYTDVEAAAQAAALIATHAANYNLHTKLIVKSADETVNNSETLQNDDELLFAVAANEVWAFMLLPIMNSSEAADINTQFTVPSGATLRGWASFIHANFGILGAELAADTAYPISASGTDICRAVFFGIVINGATAGNLQFQWAQYSAEESDTKVLEDSCILAWKLA